MLQIIAVLEPTTEKIQETQQKEQEDQQQLKAQEERNKDKEKQDEQKEKQQIQKEQTVELVVQEETPEEHQNLGKLNCLCLTICKNIFLFFFLAS